MKWYTTGILFAMICAGCAANNQEMLRELSTSDEQMRREVEEIKRQMATPASPSHVDGPDDLKARLESLRTEYARQISDLQRQNLELEGEISQLRTLVTKLDKKTETLPRKERPSKTPAIFRPGAYDVPSAYRAALEEYRATHLEQAASMFREIIVVAPESDLADNAQYWLGECHYDQADFSRALSAFQKVLTYAETEKRDDARLKIAYCYERMNDLKSARRELEKLLREDPDSEYAGPAREAIRRLRKGR